ncbi:MAG: hypothetical protein ACI936_000378 [Paraglaciecola sp.]
MVAGIAKKRGIEHVVFEHIEQWSNRVKQQLVKYGLVVTKICHMLIKVLGITTGVTFQ